ncbi:MAG: S-methyl-5'-thioadenosine phosphorylase [Polyangiaceae bacterium]|jgi:5'-methylthioadenosine phosphorylase|nr:S-methyl-5'-thioadenosine phosphorylase [Polyangiaceae bacterium]
MSVCLGVIGGSGLYEAFESISDRREERFETPFGPPSDALSRGRLGEIEVVFLPRHGRGHRASPTDVNYRANVAALKMAGVTHLVAVSAVGSLREGVAPGDLVAVDQFIDLTKRRASTFFDGVAAAHVSFGDPVCPLLTGALAGAAERASGARVHRGGTYVCMEGPQFSTRAESNLYRSWGCDVVGMTAMPEAKLAREAELPYALLALCTDYDCWHSGHGDVNVEAVVAVMHQNAVAASRTVVALASALPDAAASPAHRALDGAIMTDPARLDEARAKLGFLRPFR